LPEEMVQRRIHGYRLYSDHDSIRLCHRDGAEGEGKEEDVSLAVRRVQFDRFMMEHVLANGVQVIDSRVTDIEFHGSEVVIYSWSGTRRASVMVGAFGLGRAMCSSLAGRTGYLPPPYLEAIVSKVHPAGLDPVPGLLGDDIHVFLPRISNVEFAALVPKGNHVTIIVAGRSVRTGDVDQFLRLPAVRGLLRCDPDPEDYFKGTFPVGLARRPFGNRYVTIGDSAGLVRPFKGKGVNSAIVTGHLAALTLLDHGVTEQAFARFWLQCDEFVRDVAYGKLVRRAAGFLSHGLSMQPVLDLARKDAGFRQILYDCVSGRETFRHIVHRKGNFRMALRLLPRLLL
jgi:flavin-dependent dehydrogenase